MEHFEGAHFKRTTVKRWLFLIPRKLDFEVAARTQTTSKDLRGSETFKSVFLVCIWDDLKGKVHRKKIKKN